MLHEYKQIASQNAKIICKLIAYKNKVSKEQYFNIDKELDLLVKNTCHIFEITQNHNNNNVYNFENEMELMIAIYLKVRLMNKYNL